MGVNVIDGPVNGERLARRLTAAANRIQSVQRGTLRTSASPPAFSFVLERTRKPEAAVAEFRHAIGDAPARLALVRIMRNGELIDPRQETPLDFQCAPPASAGAEALTGRASHTTPIRSRKRSADT